MPYVSVCTKRLLRNPGDGQTELFQIIKFVAIGCLILYIGYMNKSTSQMFDSQLRPYFNGRVLMNDSATKDKAVMAALTKLAEDDFTYRSHPVGTGYWNISDRD